MHSNRAAMAAIFLRPSLIARVKRVGIPVHTLKQARGRESLRALLSGLLDRAYLALGAAGVALVLTRVTSKISVAFGGIGGCGSAP